MVVHLPELVCCIEYVQLKKENHQVYVLFGFRDEENGIL